MEESWRKRGKWEGREVRGELRPGCGRKAREADCGGNTGRSRYMSPRTITCLPAKRVVQVATKEVTRLSIERGVKRKGEG